ncbi:MAG TPA: plastocyanin/azurin family copper-binding protein, partial [Gemmatimonadaceae bacterium]|nr:plastocyanin/azurin family copper-binding protein [Gemmatimonadaceae bacterium]
MQFLGRALLTSAVVLAACAGGDSPSDTVAANSPATTPSTGAQTASPAAVTGQTHEVDMVIDGSEYKYVPSEITVKAGDAIKFNMVSGGPHNVAFEPEDIPEDMRAVLAANMPAEGGGMTKLSPLMGPLLMQPGTSYTISFAGIKPGAYPFNCTPHLAMGMVGTVTVQ